jgi:phosphoribosylformimino-5-aminoimidazole carboxamide ribotide isomerase
VFRPCIDLHAGQVKQIVGGTLSDDGRDLRTNFVASEPPGWFARKFQQDGLLGGHVIMLGPGNDAAAREALAAYPGGLQVGGGISAGNAAEWLDAGASHVIVTSWLFEQGVLSKARLAALVSSIDRDRIVLDLSCRKRGDEYVVMTDRWQRFTDLVLSRSTLASLSQSCSEFLIHAVDVEGLCRGIDERLVELLAESVELPTTYAGGARSIDDLATVQRLGHGRIDLTIGSALDLFGGQGVRYDDAVAFNRAQTR